MSPILFFVDSKLFFDDNENIIALQLARNGFFYSRKQGRLMDSRLRQLIQEQWGGGAVTNLNALWPFVGTGVG